MTNNLPITRFLTTLVSSDLVLQPLVTTLYLPHTPQILSLPLFITLPVNVLGNNLNDSIKIFPPTRSILQTMGTHTTWSYTILDSYPTTPTRTPVTITSLVMTPIQISLYGLLPSLNSMINSSSFGTSSTFPPSGRS